MKLQKRTRTAFKKRHRLHWETWLLTITMTFHLAWPHHVTSIIDVQKSHSNFGTVTLTWPYCLHSVLELMLIHWLRWPWHFTCHDLIMSHITWPWLWMFKRPMQNLTPWLWPDTLTYFYTSAYKRQQTVQMNVIFMHWIMLFWQIV